MRRGRQKRFLARLSFPGLKPLRFLPVTEFHLPSARIWCVTIISGSGTQRFGIRRKKRRSVSSNRPFSTRQYLQRFYTSERMIIFPDLVKTDRLDVSCFH